MISWILLIETQRKSEMFSTTSPKVRFDDQIYQSLRDQGIASEGLCLERELPELRFLEDRTVILGLQGSILVAASCTFRASAHSYTASPRLECLRDITGLRNQIMRFSIPLSSSERQPLISAKRFRALFLLFDDGEEIFWQGGRRR